MSGEVDMATADTMLQTALREPAERITLDLSAVTFFDSAAIHALVRLAQEFPARSPSARPGRSAGCWRFPASASRAGSARPEEPAAAGCAVSPAAPGAGSPRCPHRYAAPTARPAP
ncbi:STAS domain-containing protein [Micromonospora sp. M12]